MPDPAAATFPVPEALPGPAEPRSGAGAPVRSRPGRELPAEPTSYDAFAYPGAPFSQTHPDRLATLAALYGLSPAPPERCRVLELGCGDGANLLPMAHALPGSSFLGVDLARTAVEKGRGSIAALGLSNVSLLAADIGSISGLGTFDYVIAHGVYSWVPPPVQERLLALSREVLAPHGVAYVSYNAYPGCLAREVGRQMMRWHVRGLASPAERVGQARSLIRMLGEAAPEHPVFSAILKETAQYQNGADDSSLFHDDLADVNEPLLFLDFVERAGAHGLRFLAEADFPDMLVWNAESPSGRFLGALGEDLLLQQQYRDFLVFRRFRQTLLCRAEVPASPEPRVDAVRRLFAAASTRPEHADASVASGERLRFNAGTRGEVETAHPLSKAALVLLGEEWPRWVGVAELLDRARRRVEEAGGAPPAGEDEDRLIGFLLRLYGTDVAELRSRRCPFVTAASGRPRASALARLQASSGRTVVNLRHEALRLDDRLVRRFLALLDGTRTCAEIEREMERAVREEGGAGVEALLEALPEGVRRNLDRVAALALLEA